MILIGPIRFAVPVPVTTRAPRPTADWKLQMERRDSRFASREYLLLAEVVARRLAKYDKELYGTSFESVPHIVQTGRVAIFLANADAIQNLYESDLKPYFLVATAPNYNSNNIIIYYLI